MRKENYEQYIKRMHGVFRKTLKIEDWQGSVFISGDSHKNNPKVAGECEIQVNYLNYCVTLYLCVKEKFYRKEYNEVAHILMHELCHVYTEPLYSSAIENCSPHQNIYVEQQREQLTERISVAIMSTVPDDYIKPKLCKVMD